MVNDRAFCQIKTFCDKGAERKAREEEKRLSRQQLSGGFALSVQPRSVFQRAFDLVTEPIFFTPKARPLTAVTPPSALTMPAAPARSAVQETVTTRTSEAGNSDLIARILAQLTPLIQV